MFSMIKMISFQARIIKTKELQQTPESLSLSHVLKAKFNEMDVDSTAVNSTGFLAQHIAVSVSRHPQNKLQAKQQ